MEGHEGLAGRIEGRADAAAWLPAPRTRQLEYGDAESARSTAALLARRWVPMVLVSLQQRPLRRAQLRATIATPISDKVLTATLRRLESDGLVVRTVTGQLPPAVIYGITRRGRSLLGLVERLALWTSEAHPAEPPPFTRPPAGERRPAPDASGQQIVAERPTGYPT